MDLKSEAKTEVNVAKLGYEAYGESAGWKNFAGNPMPQWDELPPKIQEHWGRAAQAIALLLLEG